MMPSACAALTGWTGGHLLPVPRLVQFVMLGAAPFPFRGTLAFEGLFERDIGLRLRVCSNVILDCYMRDIGLLYA